MLPSLFEEQLTLEAEQVRRLLEQGASSLSAALALDDDNTGPSGYLALVEKAKATLQIPVIASLNGVTPGTWVEHATLPEEAGADALELNVYYVSSSPRSAGSEKRRCLDLVRSVREAIGIPLASSSAPTSARWPTWPASWSRRARTGWSCSTASTGPTWTWRAPAVRTAARGVPDGPGAAAGAAELRHRPGDRPGRAGVVLEIDRFNLELNLTPVHA